MLKLVAVLLFVAALGIRIPSAPETTLSPLQLLLVNSGYDYGSTVESEPYDDDEAEEEEDEDDQYDDDEADYDDEDESSYEVEYSRTRNSTWSNSTDWPVFKNSNDTSGSIFGVRKGSNNTVIYDVNFDVDSHSTVDDEYVPKTADENIADDTQGQATWANVTSQDEEDLIDDILDSDNPAVEPLKPDAKDRKAEIKNSNDSDDKDDEDEADEDEGSSFNKTITAIQLPTFDDEGLVMTETQAWTYSEGSEVDLSQYNPSTRDEETYPSDVDEKGDDQSAGDIVYLLVTTFDDARENSGSVWVIPEDNLDEGSVLIAGLTQPTGVCFDVNHDFLYVTDIEDDTGFIYQYEIEWNTDSKFKLAKDEYTVIYEGTEPFDCSVDEYGNLYFVDRALNEVSIVNYLDLWAGFKNQHTVIYDADSDSVNSPVGIDVVDSKNLYFTNNEATETAGALVSAPTQATSTNSAKATSIETTDLNGAVGVAASEDLVFFTGTDGSLNVYWPQVDMYWVKSSSSNFAGVCYGDDKVFAADNTNSQLVQFTNDNSVEEGKSIILISGPFGLHCVNWAGLLSVSFLGLLFLN